MPDFKDLYSKQLTPDETMDILNPLTQTNDAILPQPSLMDKSPLAMPNFANKQAGTGVDFVNELFKNTPAYDPRVAPQAPDQLGMEDMVIDTPVSKAQSLKSNLDKFKQLQQVAKPVSNKPQIAESAPTDDLYLNQGLSKVIQGLTTMGGGKIDDNADFYNQFRKYQLDKPQQLLEQKIKQRNFDRMSKMDDPNSQESVNMRKALSKLAPDLVKLYGEDWDKISANDKDTIFDIVRTREQIEGRKDAARLANQQRQDTRDEKKREFELRMADKQEQDLNKDIQKFQDKTQDTRNILQSINDFESVLGNNLDNMKIDTRSNKINADGKTIDVPGVSIPGIGRTTFYDSDARRLQDAASKIFNVELKHRSGAAVTDNELKRLRQEFSEGKYNTEAELMDAIKRYKNASLRILKQQEAGYKPAVVNTYKERNDANQILTTENPAAISGADKSAKKDPKIDSYAKQYNLSYDQAESILRSRGYK